MAIPIEVQNAVQEVPMQTGVTSDVQMETETIPPHTHDDRYYTESETDALLAGKSNVGHNHDDRYYTEGEVNTLLEEKAPLNHNHDGRYYTEQEVDAALAGKQDKIDASHKLSADLVADGSTNKVVSQAEKTAWNGKAEIDDSSTAANKVWSANRVNSLIGNVESLLEALL